MHDTNSMGLLLGRCANLARERMDARLGRYDVTPSQAHALLFLDRAGGQTSQYELTKFMRVRPPTANGIVDRMAEKGLVVRSVSGADARRRLITLTEKGRETQTQFQEVVGEAESLIVRGLTRAEIEALRELLRRVAQNLEEDRTLC